MIWRKLVYFYLCLLLIINMCRSQANLETDLQTFLNSRLEQTNVQLKGLLDETSEIKDVQTSIELHEAEMITLPYIYNTSRIVQLFNYTFALMGNTIYSLIPNTEFELIERMEFSQTEEDCYFIQITEYDNMGILLMAFPSGNSQIFGYFAQSWIFIQSIRNSDRVSDAKFFTNRNNLYLTIVGNAGGTLTHTLMYKWTGTHFDEISKILTKNATKILSFNNQESEIITILQRSSNGNKQKLNVFEFNNNYLKTTQLLSVHNCEQIFSYEFQNQRYLVIWETERMSTLYWWNGYEFVNWSKVENYSKVDKYLLVNINGTPLLFLIQQGFILVLTHERNNIRLIARTQFIENYKEILDLSVISNSNEYSLVIFFMLTNDSKNIKYTAMPFNLTYYTEHKPPPESPDELLHCLKSLEENIVSNKNKLNNFIEPSKKIIQVNEPLDYTGRINVAAAIKADSARIITQITSTKLQQKAAELKFKLLGVSNQIIHMNSKLSKLFKERDLVNGKLIINGDLHVQNMSLKNLEVKYLNGLKWTPEKWLSYSNQQTITGHVSLTNLHSNLLNVATNNKLFIDTVEKTVNNTFGLPTTINSLTADNIYGKKINDIEFQDVYLRSKPSIIQGVKRFDNLSTDTIQTEFLNELTTSEALQKISDITNGKFKYSDSLSIKNFNFEKLNGVNWNVFKDSVFRLGVTNRIAGNLNSANIKTRALHAKQISNIESSSLLTTSTEQIITSAIEFSHIHAENINCNVINNVNFQDIVTSKNNIIKGAVSMDTIRVLRNLHINSPIDTSESGDDHIVGTNETDLFQIYNKKVTIIGNLHLSNINTPNTVKLMINNDIFKEDLSTTYWLKTHNQIIPTHFEAQKGIDTSHLTTTLLNNVAISDYMLNNLEDKLPTNLLFKFATILGNVIINDDQQHKPNLKELDSRSIKTQGSYQITGRVSFQGKITVGNLITNYLDDVKLENAFSVLQLDKPITGEKRFDNLIIGGNVFSGSIATSILNNANLDSIKKSALFTDTPHDISILNFNNVTTENILVSKINNVDIREYNERIANIDTLSLIDNLKINGNVRIKNAQGVLYINSYEALSLLNIVLKNNGSIQLRNPIKFIGNIYAENVEVQIVNGYDFPDLTTRLLYYTWDQNITGIYRIGQINSPNIYVSKINNIETANLISTKTREPQTLLAWGGLELQEATFIKSLNTETSSCNLQEAVDKLRNPPTRYWNTVHVHHNITLLDDNSDLSKILKNAVNSKRNNIIYEQVTFQHHISANQVYLQNLVNGVNLETIIQDCVLKNVEGQVIAGSKRFDSVQMSNAFVKSNSKIPVINNFDIAKVNKGIITKSNIYSTVIKGHKVFFAGLQANRLLSEKISDLYPENLISLKTDLNSIRIKKAYFHSLSITDKLLIEYVNGINMSYVLSERILSVNDHEQIVHGTYFIEDALIVGDSIISEVNDVSVDDIVFDTDIQTISSRKLFTQDLIINGSVKVGLLNKLDLSESYKQAILMGESNTIHGNMHFINDSVISTNVKTKYINGISINYLRELMQSEIPILKTDLVQTNIKEMEDVIKTSIDIRHGMQDIYLYMEKSTDLQIPIENALIAKAFDFKGTVMLHVFKNTQGSTCELPDYCACPIQTIIQITERAVHIISEVPVQRVFSYEDEEMSIHLFTSSVSTSESCRSNDRVIANETTSLMWMNYSKNETQGSNFYSEHLTGYVSGVEYFRHNGQVFMIISRFYDSVNNTHDIACLIFKFIPEKEKIELIQQIKTNRAWTLSLFHTAQGITLIIGKLFNFEKLGRDSGAEIYRFDEATEQFMLLRKVPSSGCTHAVGVVLGSDSLIVLAHKDTPLQVLKYHPKYDNYYYYQSIFLDGSILGISVFYIGDFGISDAYLCLVTEGGNYHVYSFQYVEGWQTISNGEIEGLQTLVPFVLNRKHYLFAVSTTSSSLLAIIKHGSN